VVCSSDLVNTAPFLCPHGQSFGNIHIKFCMLEIYICHYAISGNNKSGLSRAKRVTLRRTLTRQSFRLGPKRLETHDQREFARCGNLSYVVGQERIVVYFNVSCLFIEY
jgi:hypothetical protein